MDSLITAAARRPRQCTAGAADRLAPAAAGPAGRSGFGPGSTAATGAIQRTIESNRHVTGVTGLDGELWRGTWEGEESELRRVDPDSGAVLERLQMPAGAMVSGLESNGADLFDCGGGASGKVRTVRRSAPQAATPAA